MRLIDADASIDDLMERYCKDCDKRKGIKNGKRQFIYEIGEAPCRACEVDDVKAELEEAPTIDAVPVIRCKDCKWKVVTKLKENYCLRCEDIKEDDYFCADGAKMDVADNDVG